jgi:hypothetical protein
LTTLPLKVRTLDEGQYRKSHPGPVCGRRDHCCRKGIALRLRPAQGPTWQAKPLAMRRQAWPLLRHVLGWDLTYGLLSLGVCREVGQEVPGVLALPRPRHLPPLACGPQQTATCSAYVAFQRLRDPWEARHVRAVAQTRPIAPTDEGEVTAKRLSWRRALRLRLGRIERGAAWPRDLGRIAGVRRYGCEAGGKGTAPSRTLG